MLYVCNIRVNCTAHTKGLKFL